MTNDYMQQIVRGEKNYEFRRYRIATSVKRIWFYLNAPLSHIGYICEIGPARTRNSGDEQLDEDGLGNKEFNERHKDWDGYDYAYRVRSVYRLIEPVSLSDLKFKYGIKGAPRGLVYTPDALKQAVSWKEQKHVWSGAPAIPAPATVVTGGKRKIEDYMQSKSAKKPVSPVHFLAWSTS